MRDLILKYVRQSPAVHGGGGDDDDVGCNLTEPGVFALFTFFCCEVL